MRPETRIKKATEWAEYCRARYQEWQDKVQDHCKKMNCAIDNRNSWQRNLGDAERKLEALLEPPAKEEA